MGCGRGRPAGKSAIILAQVLANPFSIPVSSECIDGAVID